MAWWNLFRRKKSLDAEIDFELRFHINQLTREKIAPGQSPERARREALLEFGGSEQVKEEVRDVHRIAPVEHTFANLKSGIRLLRRSPSFSAAVILTLALAIGANSAVFSAINAILLRPLPFPNSSELMMLLQSDRKASSESIAVAAIRLEDWNRLNGSFQAISGWYTEDASEASGILPERVKEAMVAPRFLQVWGIAPPVSHGPECCRKGPSSRGRRIPHRGRDAGILSFSRPGG